jgi:hypothetical protein
MLLVVMTYFAALYVNDIITALDFTAAPYSIARSQYRRVWPAL